MAIPYISGTRGTGLRKIASTGVTFRIEYTSEGYDAINSIFKEEPETDQAKFRRLALQEEAFQRMRAARIKAGR